MIQKNKRNTRRGRAKRWKFIPMGRVIYWVCRTGGRDRVSIQAFPGMNRPWLPLCLNSVTYKAGRMQPNRYAAMRAAEHLARAARAKGGAP